MNTKETGAFIASLRRERGMTQRQLAERLNVTDKAVSKWETGKGYPDIDSLMSLSETFGVSVNELMYAKRLNSAKKEIAAQQEIAAALIKSTKSSRKSKWLIAALVVVVVILVIVRFALNFFTASERFSSAMSYNTLCVISDDYNTITIYGEEYTRFLDLTSDAVCTPDKMLFRYPYREGKMSVSDEAYSVKYCDNYDFIYLKSVYAATEGTYCKSTKMDDYSELLASEKADRYYAYYFNERSPSARAMDFEGLSDRFGVFVRGLSESDAMENMPRDDGTFDLVTVYARDERSPVLFRIAEVARIGGAYYYLCDNPDTNYDDRHPYGDCYALPDDLAGEMNAVFELNGY